MSNIKPIDAVMWAVVDKEGNVQEDTIRYSEKYAINAIFERDWAWIWERFQLQGYTCQQVRVIIEPINTTNNG
jgi:hypothetical protein